MELKLSYAEIGALISSLQLRGFDCRSAEYELCLRLLNAVYEDMSDKYGNNSPWYEMWLNEFGIKDM